MKNTYEFYDEQTRQFNEKILTTPFYAMMEGCEPILPFLAIGIPLTFNDNKYTWRKCHVKEGIYQQGSKLDVVVGKEFPFKITLVEDTPLFCMDEQTIYNKHTYYVSDFLQLLDNGNILVATENSHIEHVKIAENIPGSVAQIITEVDVVVSDEESGK